jgi:hypothetical protein
MGTSGQTIDVSAQDEGPILFGAIYFPWVPHGDTIDDTGPWYGTITVQNIDVNLANQGVRIWVFDSRTMNRFAIGEDGLGNPYSFEDALEDNRVPRYDLDPNASVTLSAGELGIEEPGSALSVYAVYKAVLDEPQWATDLGAPVIAGVQKQAAAVPMTNARTTVAHLSVDGYTAIPFADVAWGSQSVFCHQISDGVDSCDGSGFYSLPGGDEGGFDGHSYLPIVQTNNGWNTEIYFSNVDFTSVSAAQVNVTLIASDQQGFAASAEHKITETFNLPAGGSAVMDVSEWVGDEWIGSAHITSVVGVVTAAMRSKPEDNMLMINTSAPSLKQTTGDAYEFAQLGIEEYQQYAPLIFRDYNGWSTGFSFVNIAEQTNRLTITYYSAGGITVATDTRVVSPQGQEFIHIPAQQDLGLGGSTGAGFVGAAVFTSSLPFHVAVDQVKYSTGEAMSYLATASGATFDGPVWPADDFDGALVMPLVQKGMLDGRGDVSGLQVFNPNVSDTITFQVTFYDSAGAVLPPTKNRPIEMSLGPTEIATLYTMHLSEMAQNQRSSAVIVPIAGTGQIVGVSNNVNYSVEGDGSTAFNMLNINGQYRFPAPGFGH